MAENGCETPARGAGIPDTERAAPAFPTPSVRR